MDKDMINGLVATTKSMGCVTSVYFGTEEGITVEVASYPKGMRPSKEVLDELIEWLEDYDEFADVLNKIEELEEGHTDE